MANMITDSTKFKQWISTINEIITKLNPATHTQDGLLTKDDKIKLDSIENGAGRVDIDNVSVSVNDINKSYIITGNTGNTHTLNFISGNGITLNVTESEEGADTKYDLSIAAESYAKATPSTSTTDGTLGLIQATAGSSERMLFADMQWREALFDITVDSSYPVSSKAVYNALNNKAPLNHASSETLYGIGNASEYGHVKITDTPSSSIDASSGVAVSPKALYDVNQTAVLAGQQANENAQQISQLSNKIVGTYRYAGSVDSYDELLTISASTGDVYNVKTPIADDGPNYAWNGMSWDNLGGLLEVDTSIVQHSKNPVTSGAVYDALENKAPLNHASTEMTYGIGSETAYGHIKVTDDINNASGSESGIAAAPSITNRIWKYAQELRDMIAETGNFKIFQSAEEAIIPDVYEDNNAALSVPSKIAFAEVNTVVNEITDRVENVELTSVKKTGDNITGNIVFQAGTQENILYLSSQDDIQNINPLDGNNFILDCALTAYEIEIMPFDGESACFYLVIDGGEGVNITWPDTVHWSNGLEPYLSAGVDILKFYTIDGGMNWYVTHELSNASSNYTVLGIAAMRPNYIYRIMNNTINKIIPPVKFKNLRSTTSDGNAFYMLVDDVDTDNNVIIYRYDGNTFEEYAKFEDVIYGLNKITYQNNVLYAIDRMRTIYRITGGSPVIAYELQHASGTSNEIITLLKDKDAAYIAYKNIIPTYAVALSKAESEGLITDSMLIYNIDFYGTNYKSIDNAQLIRIKNNIIAFCFYAGLILIDEENNTYKKHNIEVHRIVYTNGNYVYAYFNNGIGILSIDDINTVVVKDWKYIGEDFIVNDMANTAKELLLTGEEGKRFNKFAPYKETYYNSTPYMFNMVKIPLYPDYKENKIIDNVFNFDKIRFYEAAETDKAYEISLIGNKPAISEDNINYTETAILKCIITKKNYVAFVDIHANMNAVPNISVTMKSVNNIFDNFIRTIEIPAKHYDATMKCLIDCHTESLNQHFFACCDYGYIIYNFDTNNYKDARVVKIENLPEDENIVAGYYYEKTVDGAISRTMTAISATGYMTSYNTGIMGWEPAIQTTLEDGGQLTRCCRIMNENDTNIVMYGFSNNAFKKFQYMPDNHAWQEKLGIFSINDYPNPVDYVCSANIDEKFIFVFKFINENDLDTPAVYVVDSLNNDSTRIEMPATRIGYVTGIEVIGDTCFMTTTDGYIIMYKPNIGTKIVYDSYGTRSFSGFIKTFDKGYNYLYAISDDGFAFLYDQTSETWNLNGNTVIGSKTSMTSITV